MTSLSPHRNWEGIEDEFKQDDGGNVSFKNREAIVAWLHEHQGRRIRLGAEGSTLRVEGMPMGVEKLDACSTEFLHCEMDCGLAGLRVSFSLHESRLALHVLSDVPGQRGSSLSLPLSLPYDQVRLSTVEEGASNLSPSSQSSEEPEYSPYELLHFGTD